MLKRYQYETQEERQALINDNSDFILIQEENITEGNFLTFSDKDHFVYRDSPINKVDALEKENQILKARNDAITERADFIEDIIAEMATKVYT